MQHESSCTIPFGVRQSAIPDAVIERVEFVDVHSGDERIEHVFAAHDPVEGALDARLRAPVLELVAVHGGEDDRFDPPAQEDRRCGAADAEKFRSVEVHDCGTIFAGVPPSLLAGTNASRTAS
jgi:hypothetical protein